ncbi:methyltransferase type 11 [Thauera sp.]|uniref:methyltransferase type 11 n=1 Tax=Thauera sp. TaxID=1905334 RepID=UPI0039E2B32B
MANIRFTPLRAGTTNAAGERISSIDPLLSRTNYFDGQLLKASDLNRDQIYLDERLLELGQVFGAGIVRGLEPSLRSGHVVEVTPGIAIAPSGRVLQLNGGPLTIDLLDSGLIATLNDGRFRSYARGLYALALTHAETIDGVAEAYPKDLAAARTPHVSAWAEGVELRLMPLPLPLPQQDEIAVRANLARELLGSGERLALPSDDAVALGLLAVERGRILWLDRGLLRRPQRALNTPNAVQQDLAAHYQELLQAVFAARRSSGLRGAFAASQYFRVLPPWGSLPQDSIDPVDGRQQFFPKDFEVSIAPVRRSELAAVLADSAHLAPIDLERDADCDVMVLAPMSDAAFALRARQLEAPAEVVPRALGRLARLDRLALRVLPQPPIHRIDADADVWRAIWAEANPDEILYVRRPPRTAETAVSAVVLALGTTLPPPSATLPPDAARLEDQLDAALEASDTAEEARAALAAEAARLKIRIAELEKAVALGGDQRLADALAEIERLALALEAARKEIEALKSDQRNAAVLANALEATSAQIDKLKADLDAARAEIERLKTTASPIDETVKRRIDELSRMLDDERARSTGLDKEGSTLAAQLKAAKLQIAQLEAELKEARIRLETAGGTDTDLQAAREEIDKLKAEIGDIRKARDNADAELADARSRLEASLERETRGNSSLAELRAALDKAESEARTQDAQRTALEERVKKADAEIAKLKQDGARAPDLEAALSLESLARARGANEAGIKAAGAADALIGAAAEARIAAAQIAGLADRRLDPALWPSMQAIARADAALLEKLRDHLFELGSAVDLPKFFVSEGKNYGLAAAQIRLWESLAG